MFLKIYATDNINCPLLQIRKQTWVGFLLEIIQILYIGQYDSRIRLLNGFILLYFS